MRIRVEHSTTYRYDAPVFLEPHVFRLRPRVDGAQRLLAYSLEISPKPAGANEVLDQDGNVATHAWFAGAMTELTLRSTFELETLRENPFDYILPVSEFFALPLVYREPLASALAPYLARPESAEVHQFAEELSLHHGGRTLDFLAALTTTLYERSTHIVRDEGAPLAAEETLRVHSGSCRDLAVLFCEVCRCLGIPARFVSGYDCGAGYVEHAYMHAWAEVYLEGGGWRGYDPSRGLAVADGHVAVAAAADPRLAAPSTGTFRGKAHSEMQFHIDVQAA